MQDRLYIITNESINLDKDNRFYCDNIDLKSIPEELNKFSKITIIARHSQKQRSKKINIDEIKISKNIVTYLIEIFKSLKNDRSKYLIISLSPYTLLASVFLKIFLKKHYIYLRSDGFREYKAILGFFGPYIYSFIFQVGVFKANLIACRKHLLRKKNGTIVNPSQLNEKWFKEIKTIAQNKNKLLYVGRMRVEKGIFSLLNILKDTKYLLTIVTSEKEVKLDEIYNNVNLMNFENNNDEIIDIYDDHSIFVLPSFTEAHPQVLDESLARCRPVIVFKDIEHVKRDREGVFVCERNLKSFEETINYINDNYDDIAGKIKNNKLPTKMSFISELKKILST